MKFIKKIPVFRNLGVIGILLIFFAVLLNTNQVHSMDKAFTIAYKDSSPIKDCLKNTLIIKKLYEYTKINKLKIFVLISLFIYKKEIIKFLKLKYINFKAKTNLTLLDCIKTNNLEVAERLLKNGLNPNEEICVGRVDDIEYTELVYKVPLLITDNPEFIKLLIKYKADTNKRSTGVVSGVKCTPIQKALSLGNKDVVKVLADLCNFLQLNSLLLILAGVDEIFNQFKVGFGGIILINNENKPEIITVLVEAGAAVDSRDNEGETSLHITRNLAIAIELIMNGADINAKNNNGDTPLICKAKQFNEKLNLILKYFNRDLKKQKLDHIKEIIRILLYLGADTTIKNEIGQDFYDFMANLPHEQAKEIEEIIADYRTYVAKEIQTNTTLIPDLANIVAEYL